MNSKSSVWHESCKDVVLDRKVDVPIGFLPVVGDASVVVGLGVGHGENPVEIPIDFTPPHLPVRLHRGP